MHSSAIFHGWERQSVGGGACRCNAYGVSKHGHGRCKDYTAHRVLMSDEWNPGTKAQLGLDQMGILRIADRPRHG
eukprot:3025486-Prymnesium_polylepis.1